MKQFFISFFANLAALLLVFGAPLLILFLCLVISLSFSSKGQHFTFIERGSILVFDMSINVTDSPEHATSSTPLDAALNQNATKSMTLRSLVDRAAKGGQGRPHQGASC